MLLRQIEQLLLKNWVEPCMFIYFYLNQINKLLRAKNNYTFHSRILIPQICVCKPVKSYIFFLE